jgi:aspartyl-tRNA(Asn)/glutamyl-tRNA(Gln) amidotransferase subunit C
VPLGPEQVRHIAHLVRLHISDTEVALYSEQLSEVLDYAEMLRALDTSAIPPTAQVVPHAAVLRADQVCDSLPTELALANAPHSEDGFFVVAAILEQS